MENMDMIQNILPSVSKGSFSTKNRAPNLSNSTPVNFSRTPQTDTFTRFGTLGYFRQRNIDTALDSTKISHGDPKTGKLNYRGYDIKDLVQNSNFNESAYLILH